MNDFVCIADVPSIHGVHAELNKAFLTSIRQLIHNYVSINRRRKRVCLIDVEIVMVFTGTAAVQTLGIFWTGPLVNEHVALGALHSRFIRWR